MYAQRPKIVTFIALGVLAIGLFHFWQSFAIGSRTDIALAYGGKRNLIVMQQVAGFMWGGFWVWMAWRIVRSQSHKLVWVAASFLFYTLFWWLLAQLSPSNLDQARWFLWVIIATALYLVTLSFNIIRNR